MDLFALFLQAAPEDPVSHPASFSMVDTHAIVIYCVALVLAIFLDWRFGRIRWYWHVGAVALAIAVGFMRPLEGLAGPKFDLAIGATFTFLFVWGVSEVFFKAFRLPHHR
jgi:hypothetical protein